MKNISLGFNTSGNNQSFGRTSQSVALGKLGSSGGSIARKFNYCNRGSPDLNVTFRCVFDSQVSISEPKASGKYQAAVGINNVDNVAVFALSSDFGITWKENTYFSDIGITNLSAVAISADGKYVLTGGENTPLFYSNDGGKTFKSQTLLGSQVWFSMQMSKSGQYQSVTGPANKLYVSDNYGESFTEITGLELIEASGYIGMSYDGKYQSVTGNVTGDIVYTSDNYGKQGSWKQRNLATKSPPPGQLYGIGLSENGQIQVTINSEGDGNVYRSLDYGVTWNYISTLPTPPGTLYQIGVSGTGQYQLIPNSTSGFGLFISKDGGNSFSNDDIYIDGVLQTTIVTILNWFPCAVSVSGKYQTACTKISGGEGGYIYTSEDFGKNWTKRTSSQYFWLGVGMG